ncbi:redoxin domain-containing protein [Spirosoma sp. BT704]|uniref:Redoxin domain-containing protein n=2 Tax=Spirosoma validum TaxID=2771355 RepID=A0A927GCE9_9BACT|nr:redoxin domain-containing protein [Spirosoma validum]
MGLTPLHIPTYQGTSFQESPRVLIFFDTECPICQKTTRRVQDLADQYTGQVQFEAIYPTETTTLADVKAFERTFKLTIPRQLDPTHKLVRQYKATTTPEVLLISAQDKILYRGSVDDQFYRLGRYRPAPTAFYLKDAIEATLVGKSIAIKQTTPTGCLINRD